MRDVISDATGDDGASYHPPHPPPHTACAANAQMSGDTPRAAPRTAATSWAATGPVAAGVVCDRDASVAEPNDERLGAALAIDMLFVLVSSAGDRGASDAIVMNTPARMSPVKRCMDPPKSVKNGRRWRATRRKLLNFQHQPIEETGGPRGNR
jgi:hypothetical protein